MLKEIRDGHSGVKLGRLCVLANLRCRLTKVQTDAVKGTLKSLVLYLVVRKDKRSWGREGSPVVSQWDLGLVNRDQQLHESLLGSSAQGL